MNVPEGYINEAGHLKPLFFHRDQEKSYFYDIYIIADFPLDRISHLTILFLQAVGFRVCLSRFNLKKNFSALELIGGLQSSRWVLFLVTPNTFSYENQKLSQWEFLSWCQNCSLEDVRVMFINASKDACQDKGHFATLGSGAPFKVSSMILDVHDSKIMYFSTSRQFAGDGLHNQIDVNFLQHLLSLFDDLRDKFLSLSLIQLRNIVFSIYQESSHLHLIQQCQLLTERLSFTVKFQLIGSEPHVGKNLESVVANTIERMLSNSTNLNARSTLQLSVLIESELPVYGVFSDSLLKISATIRLEDLIKSGLTVLAVLKTHKKIPHACSEACFSTKDPENLILPSIEVELSLEALKSPLTSAEPVFSRLSRKFDTSALAVFDSQTFGEKEVNPALVEFLNAQSGPGEIEFVVELRSKQVIGIVDLLGATVNEDPSLPMLITLQSTEEDVENLTWSRSSLLKVRQFVNALLNSNGGCLKIMTSRRVFQEERDSLVESLAEELIAILKLHQWEKMDEIPAFFFKFSALKSPNGLAILALKPNSTSSRLYRCIESSNREAFQVKNGQVQQMTAVQQAIQDFMETHRMHIQKD
eukprot:TRINITY_DN1769_c0_g1_i1.p1 TRINITY_DN1769_c0_g1~~TRINITY_DN1769_c0_g1_i1.p1  ORF type:complete len:662 (-),score=149.25 TRINITY_DN1769_c0_g1_i1:1041-2801(-)